MRKFLSTSAYLSIALILGLLACACSRSGDDEPDGVDTLHRTVLVYMVATNNLHSSHPAYDYDHHDLEEMRQAALAGGLNGGRLLVYHVSGSDDPRLLEILPDGSERVLATYPPATVSVSAEQMNRVLDEAFSIAPASQYGLVLWSHGSGWLEDGLEEKSALYSYGLDGSKKRMNVSVLANVLKGRGLSFIYFDCCYMGGVEVMYELKDCAPYIVASASELPVNGMNYTSNIPCFFADGEADLRQAARNTFDYYDGLSGAWRTCTISLIDTSKLDALAQACRAMFAEMSLPLSFDVLPQRYDFYSSYYFDLSDYAAKAPVSEETAEAVARAVDDAVLCRYNTPWLWQGESNQMKINTHCGLSTFIVSKIDDISIKNYRNLRWYKDVVSALTEKQ